MSRSMSMLAACAAGVSLSLAGSAQEPGSDLLWTNLGELRAPTPGAHVLTGKAAALVQLESMRAELFPYAYQEQIEYAGPSGLEQTNTGELRPLVFSGHVFSGSPADGIAEGAPVRVLYAPSEADDPAYRAAIAAAIGSGATVDYFDARAATPSVATLAQYDAAYTWANFAYSNNVLFGDNLAAYNDMGGTVVLGVFCTYTSGNFLSGQIMTSGYCPVVSPTGTNHFSSSSYVGDGTTCIYDGVSSLVCTFRDFLVTQGSGVKDGSYADGEICHAYRGTGAVGQGDVVYSNGAGAVQLAGTGQWGAAVGNSSICSLTATGPRILYAPSEADDPAYRAAIAAAGPPGTTVDYFDASASTTRKTVLAGYDAVHVWANFAFHLNVFYGDNLAWFVDNVGGDVVLGAFCTYTSGNFLSGQIMTAGYCPVVSPTGTNHFSNDTDTGPFSPCIGAGVFSLTAFYRDFLVTQGTGLVDSTYDLDGEICIAYRPNPGGGVGNIVYANGSGGQPVLGPGNWPQVIVNAVTCDSVSAAAPSCSVRLGLLGLNPADFACVSQPLVGETFHLGVEMAPSVGSSTLATIALVGLGGPTSGAAVLGHELLVKPPFVGFPGLGAHDLAIPQSAALIGATLSVQGARIESGPSAIVLTNALDLKVGL